MGKINNFITRSLPASNTALKKTLRTNFSSRLITAIFCIVIGATLASSGCDIQDDETGSLTLRMNSSGSNSADVSSYGIALKGPNNQIRNSSTDADGIILIEDLTPGTWTITVDALNESGVSVGSVTETVAITADQIIMREITVTVIQPNPSPVTGSLALRISSTGGTVSSYSVVLTGPSNPVNRTTGADGNITINGLATGLWSITINALNASNVLIGSKTDTVQVSANTTVTRNITITIGTTTPPPTQTELKGWQINETNTGLRGDYSKLSELNLNGSDAGKGTISYGTFRVNKGVTISYRIIKYSLDLSAGDITIDHCLIKPTSIGLGIPIVRGGNSTILDSEIDGSSIPDSQVYYSFLVSSFTGVIKRCNIHGASSGIWINNNSATQAIAENNYVHGLKYVSGTDSHVDGITVRRSSGSGGVLVKNNKIVSEPSKSNTGPCFIKAWEGYVNNVLIEGNLFQGYGYSIILEASGHGYGSNMRCKNNRIDPWNGWTTYVLGGSGWFEWSENYRYNASAQDCKGAVVNEP